MATLPNGQKLQGKLFVVEGIDGSGKSTQLDLLKKWLIGEGYCVAFSEWNSSPVVEQTTRLGKKKHMLTPLTFSLIHAADFADRMDRQMLPALKAGAVVMADRYVYTAFARDAARGLDREWLRRLYSFAVKPTVAFYFDVPLEESLRRILAGRPALKYYEAGMDLHLSEDPYKSFELFQGRILDEYNNMIDKEGLTVINATLPLVKQQDMVREIVSRHLKGVLRTEPSAWRAVLTNEALYGRYIDEVLHRKEGS
jgi:dTMP kinase